MTDEYADFTAEKIRAIQPRYPVPKHWAEAVVKAVKAAQHKGSRGVYLELPRSPSGYKLDHMVDWLKQRGFAAKAQHGDQRDPMHGVNISW
jgi:hypothetical protein